MARLPRSPCHRLAPGRDPTVCRLPRGCEIRARIDDHRAGRLRTPGDTSSARRATTSPWLVCGSASLARIDDHRAPSLCTWATITGPPKLVLAVGGKRSGHRQRVEAVESWKSALLATLFQNGRKSGEQAGFPFLPWVQKGRFSNSAAATATWLVEPAAFVRYPGGCGSW